MATTAETNTKPPHSPNSVAVGDYLTATVLPANSVSVVLVVHATYVTCVEYDYTGTRRKLIDIPYDSILSVHKARPSYMDYVIHDRDMHIAGNGKLTMFWPTATIHNTRYTYTNLYTV